MPSQKIIAFPRQTKKNTPKRRNLYADGRYCVRVTVTNPDGTKTRKAFYSRVSQREAKKKADEYKAILARGTPPADIDMTVARWTERWLATLHGLSTSAMDTYMRNCNTIIAHIGDMRVREVRSMHLQPIMNAATGKSKSHISKLKQTIKRLFAAAEENELCEKNPAANLTAPKGTYTGHRALDQWEIDLILNHWRAHPAGWCMLLLLMTGMRRGEALARVGADYDKDAQEIKITRAAHREKNALVLGAPKTDAGVRTIPVFGALRDALDEKSFSATESMLQKNSAAIGSNSAFVRMWGAALLALEKIANGLDPNQRKPLPLPQGWIVLDWSPHDLRYTYATILYDAGVDEKTAQRWMGHTDAKMTRDLYAQLSEARKAQSTEALAQHLTAMKNALAGAKGISEGIKP